MSTALDLSSELPAPEQTAPVGRVIRAGKRTRAHMFADVQRLGLTTIALASSGSTTLLFNLICVRVLSPGAYGNVARTFSLGMAVAQLTMAGSRPRSRVMWHTATVTSTDSRAGGEASAFSASPLQRSLFCIFP